ncbi:MAG TPA: carboxypeptidase regulatory-like domain-containing protein [bacterium]|nr:carboxypeptidase regulatory-like domain-containing protein [bacterium]
MKRMFVLLAGLALVAGLHAADTTGISGIVANAHNGHPIAGAAVCTGHGGACTDSNGYYLIPIQAGTYQVTASATGFQCEVYPESVVVVQGHVTDSIDFALVPLDTSHGTISGKVTDAQTGSGIDGALLVACGPDGSGETHSYACGGYQIASLPPGKYQVSASATGYEPATYPESVVVVGGQNTPDIDFALVPTGGGHGGIAGFVSDSLTGDAIAGALVTATGPHGSGQEHTCQHGGYLISNLPAGKYSVCAQAQGYKSKVYPESVEVIGGQVTEQINFALAPDSAETGGISGQVTNSVTGDPIFGALVVAHGPSHGQGNTCQHGYYYIGELAPGIYEVVAGARGFKTSAPETVEVHTGQVTQHVDFALEPEDGQTGGISGTVTDSVTGAPIASATLFAWGPGGQGWATSDSMGYYLIQELRHGKYLVRACAYGYHPKVYPESVLVVPGQVTESIGFALAPSHGGGMAGFVYDGISQTELSGALVTATGSKGSGQAYTGTWGEYRIEGLEPDDYSVTITAPGYHAGAYFEPVMVQTDVITSFVSPAIYQLTGVQESREPADGVRLSVVPNVFSRSTTVRWQIAEGGRAVLRVFDKAGRAVRTLAHSRLDRGSFSVVWDGKDASGTRLARGTYFVELRSPGGRLVTRAVLVNR